MTCEHRGCTADAIPCYLIDDDPHQPNRASYHFCPEHAPDEGFCAACGRFVAGSDEEFDCAMTPYCEVCGDEIDDDLDDLDMDDLDDSYDEDDWL